MSRVRIPPVLSEATGGALEVTADGSTLGAVLKDLFRLHPALRDRVTEDGRVSRYVNVYVNERDVRRRDGLETEVGPDDTIILLPAMAGESPRTRR